MKYEIVATLGPSSQAETVWREMLAAGVTAFRLNTSHLALDQIPGWLDGISRFAAASGVNLPVVLDLQGSKWRLGKFFPAALAGGQVVELILAESSDRLNVLPVPHADFFQAAAASSGEIVLSDARLRLQIEAQSDGRLTARVTQGGEIAPNKGITLASSKFRKEALSEKDQAIVRLTEGLDSIQYALSYVKDAAEMRRYRKLFHPRTHLIAKLERREAVEEAGQMVDTADALWLCRGDLGAELGMAAMAKSVYRFAELPGSLPLPVLMAGQVLEHMTGRPTPTRSEVCYLYDTLMKGYRGFVLSDETAIGRHPVQSCQTAALFKI